MGQNPEIVIIVVIDDGEDLLLDMDHSFSNQSQCSVMPCNTASMAIANGSKE